MSCKVLLQKKETAGSGTVPAEGWQSKNNQERVDATITDILTLLCKQMNNVKHRISTNKYSGDFQAHKISSVLYTYNQVN